MFSLSSRLPVFPTFVSFVSGQILDLQTFALWLTSDATTRARNFSVPFCHLLTAVSLFTVQRSSSNQHIFVKRFLYFYFLPFKAKRGNSSTKLKLSVQRIMCWKWHWDLIQSQREIDLENGKEGGVDCNRERMALCQEHGTWNIPFDLELSPLLWVTLNKCRQRPARRI